MKFSLALILSALCGYISLSYEILWYRVYSFVSAGSAPSFGLLLGAYLFGIAFGSWGSQFFCHDTDENYSPSHLKALALFVGIANILGFLFVPFVAFAVGFVHYAWTLFGVVFVMTLLGATLPLISHFGIKADASAGQNLSYLYLSNIIGSATGSLITGFVLMDILSLQQISTFLALLGLLLSSLLMYLAKFQRKVFVFNLSLLSISAILILVSSPVLFNRLYDKLFLKKTYNPSKPFFTEVLENRSGVITVDVDGAIYGGGIYDGYFNLDVKQQFYLIRPYAISAIHPNPSEVLIIGLSSGSWANIIANNPNVSKITIVEINPGYLELIPKFPMVNSLLKNPKVEIILDDGRRFLSRHPERKFDMIVSNGTYHWRAHSSNLLSQEFLSKIRAHLKKDGIFFYNTTYSYEVQKTAITVFPYALLVVNAIAVSDSPIEFNKERFRSILENYTLDGHRLFDFSQEEDQKIFKKILSLADSLDTPVDPKNPLRLESREAMLSKTAEVRIITDDNMGTEWLSTFRYR